MSPRSSTPAVLAALESAADGLSADQVATLVGRHPGNIRRVLGQLCEQGLVRRTPGQGRHVTWSRTDRPAPATPATHLTVNIQTAIPASAAATLRQLAHANGCSVAALTRHALNEVFLNDVQPTLTESPLAS